LGPDEDRRAQLMRASVLEQLVQGAPLTQVLEAVVYGIEADLPGAIASIMLLDREQQCLRTGAAPGLPEEYIRAIDGVRIGPSVGSCGTAAYTGELVIVEDVATHPYWAAFRDLPLQAGLRACWSLPVRDRAQQVLGTFAIYHRSPGVPHERELGVIESCSSLVAIAIEYHQVQATLHRTQNNLRTLLDNFPFMVWLKDADSRLVAANTAYARIAGVATTQELEGKTDFDFFPQDLAAEYVDGDRKAMQSGEPVGGICPLKDASGRYSWIEFYKSALITDGRVMGTVGYARDITATVQREREYRSLIENSPSTFVRYDSQARRVFVNMRQAEYYGTTQEFLIGKRPSDYPGGASACAFESVIRGVFESGENADYDLHWMSSDGRERVLRVRLAPELDANNQVMAVIGVGQDVTESLEIQARIRHMAYYDALTELPNRAMFLDRIGTMIAAAGDSTQPIGLILLDLDHFKRVNDTLGHATGDRLLAEAAKRLLGCIRNDDLASRIGGDEFAILVPQISHPDDLTHIANRIIRTFSLPFEVGGKELFVSASVGIAMYPTDSGNIDELFKFADSAMYHAKSQGRNNFQFYSASMTDSIAERMRLEGDMRRALTNGEMQLHFQPKVDLRSGRIIGAEALLRWYHPEKGVVAPDQFISIAEETGMIVGIGEWVIATACRAVVEWNRGRDTPLHVAINLSTRQFIHNDLVGSIRRNLIDSGCRPQWLQLEITESLLLEDNDAIRRTLEELHQMGLTISIDDFGTGFSSLSYLNKFPVGQIKIDRSFVRNITTEKNQASLVSAIISMARSLEKEAVAEGVETDEQARLLADLGCLVGQGYLYGKPLARPHFESRIGLPTG
jgi:diguanylate cyclase (GGDEF)-like protein/PAS domain S-box-containing protein